MGEQGAESVHAHVHKLEANYSGITNRLDRQKYIFNEYVRNCSSSTKPEASCFEKKKQLKFVYSATCTYVTYL